MGCACIKHLSDDHESDEFSFETIQIKETSHIVPDICLSMEEIEKIKSPVQEEAASLEPEFVYSVQNNSDCLEVLEVEINEKRMKKVKLEFKYSNDFAMIDFFTCNKRVLMLAGGNDITLNKEIPDCLFIILNEFRIEKVASLNFPKRRARLLYDNGNVYCIGGFREIKTRVENRLVIKQIYSNNFEKYSIQTNTWENLKDMPIGNELPGCEILNNTIHVFGGAHVSKGEFNMCYMIQTYSLQTHIWQVLPITLYNPSYGSLSILSNSDLLLYGGINNEEENNSELFSLSTQTSIKLVDPNISLFFPYNSTKFNDLIYSFNDEDQLVCLNLVKLTVEVLNIN